MSSPRTLFILLSLVILLAIVPGCQREPETPATLILHNGQIVTMAENQQSSTEPQAVAIAGDKILFVGDNDTALKLANQTTKLIDLAGATVIPGFHDAHCHLYGLGKSLVQIDLMGTGSPEEIAAKVKAAGETHPGTSWLQGRGWDQNDWPVKEYPTAAVLDQVSGDRPVFLRRVDGHAAWANSAALKLANISSATTDPAGGQIIRDSEGQPTGILIDNAADLVRSIIPKPNANEVEHRVRIAMEHCLSFGITAVQEAGTSWERALLYKRLAADNQLGIRLYTMYDDIPETLEKALPAGPVTTKNQMLTIRGLKLYADGALGSRGALMLEDYSDSPGHKGLPVTSIEHMRSVAEQGAASGFQVCTHAIGDGGNRLTLDLYEEIISRLNLQDVRWRVEHAQILSPQDIPRFAELGVIASMQPVHCTSDMDWAAERIGDQRIKGAYAWKSLLDSGAHVCWGTDFPVERVDPRAGLFAARTRTHANGQPEGGWQPQEKLAADTALQLYTVAPAYAAFMEENLGRIQPGFLADITVLDQNPITCSDEQLLQLKVLWTIVGGNVGYSAE